MAASNGYDLATSSTRHENSGADDIEDGLRLAGVRSHNPFASDERGDHQTARPDTELESIDPGESVPTSAVNPEPGQAAFPPVGQESNNRDAAGAELQPLNSDVNQDRRERGTDIFANVDPGFPEDGRISPGQSESNGDSDHEESPAKIRFAHSDSIDKTPTREDGEREDPDGIMEKIKSLGHDTKHKIHLLETKVAHPLRGFNPTKVNMRVRFGDDDPSKEVGIIWRSRDNRKGRNSIVVPRASMAYPNLPPKNRPVYSSSFKGVGRNLYRMAFTFPYWDMAFWSGWSYTWGSVLFVIDGIWAWGPVGWDVSWPGIEKYGVGLAFFFGALLYQLGATMAYLEAVNDGSFHGSAMKRFLEGHQDEQKRMLDEKVHRFFGHLNPLHEKKVHAAEEAERQKLSTIDPEAGWKTIHRRERPGSIYPGGKDPAPRRGGVDLGEAEEGEAHEYLTWRWFPTWHALRTHHVYEIGYLACSIQLFGATLYSWCGLVSIPTLSATWSKSDFYGAYYMPDIVGSSCFLTASLMFLLETQERWWKPQLNVTGWWIGFWAMIGSWGFLTNAIFGTIAEAQPDWAWAEYAAECCTTWGSFGYLLSSLFQWYEAVNKHPVEELLNEPGEMKSYQIHPV